MLLRMCATRIPGLCILNFLLISAVLIAEATIQWEEPTKVVQQGDTFSMTCEMSELGWMDVVRLVKENEGQDSHISISDMNIVKPPFAETNRYTVELNRKEKKAILSFTGVRGEDGGRIGCHKLNSDDPEIAWSELNVQVPIADMYIASRDETGHETRVTDAEMVTLQQGKPGGALCKATVSGSLTAPTLRVLVDGEDKTALFDAAPKSEELPSGGLPKYSSEMKLTYETMNPDASFNGKEFVCEGEMEGFEKRSVKAMFTVEFKPIVKCSKYKYHAELGTAVTFSCDVQSNPPATILWTWGDDKKILSGQADEENHLAAEEKALEAVDQKQVNLEIAEVTEPHLGTYTLTATNDYGSQSVGLELIKASAAPKPEVSENKQGNQNSRSTVQDPQSVTGAGVRAAPRSWWSMLVSLPFSLLILITVT